MSDRIKTDSVDIGLPDPPARDGLKDSLRIRVLRRESAIVRWEIPQSLLLGVVPIVNDAVPREVLRRGKFKRTDPDLVVTNACSLPLPLQMLLPSAYSNTGPAWFSTRSSTTRMPRSWAPETSCRKSSMVPSRGSTAMKYRGAYP